MPTLKRRERVDWVRLSSGEKKNLETANHRASLTEKLNNRKTLSVIGRWSRSAGSCKECDDDLGLVEGGGTCDLTITMNPASGPVPPRGR